MDDFDINDKYQEAESLLNKNRLSEAKAVIEYIEARQKVALHNSGKKRTLVSLIIVLSSIILVSVAMKLTIPTTEISLTLKTNGMRIEYMEGLNDYALTGSITGRHPSLDNIIYFNSVSLGTFQNFPLLADKPLSGDISMQADNVELADLVLNSHDHSPILMLDILYTNFVMHIINASISGKIIPKNTASISVDGQQNSKNYGYNKSSQVYYFVSGGSAQQPVPDSITVSREYSVDLAMNNIRYISFSRADPAKQNNYFPTILEGNLYLADIDKELKINKDEFLSLECKDCNQSTITYADNYLVIHIKGKVRKLNAGYRDNISNYMPTILEYLYQNQKLAMIWTAILFCWGLIWNMRRWIN